MAMEFRHLSLTSKMDKIQKTIIEVLDWIMHNTKSNDETQEFFKIELQNDMNELLNQEESKEPCCEMPKEKNEPTNNN